MKQVLQNHIIQFGVLSFWFLFWFLNTIDKFIGGQVGFFTGTNRMEQFVGYYSSIGIDNLVVSMATLVGVSIAESIAALLLLLAIIQFLRNKKVAADALFFWGTFVGLLIFSFFTIGDQIFGDRSELLEYSIYWIALVISWGAYEFFPRMK